MSALTIKCQNGHSNSTTQKFCGDCGLPLSGVCPNGHQNPDGRRYCGECGTLIPGLDGVGGPTEEHAAGHLRTDTAYAQQNASSSALQVGQTFTTGTGQQATIRGITGNDVWVDVQEQNGTHAGTFRFSVTAVETALARQVPEQPAEPLWRAAINERAENATAPPPDSPAPMKWQTPSTAPTPLPSGGAMTASATGLGGGLGAFWSGLPKLGKVAAVAVPGVLLLVILVSAFGGNQVGRDQQSYDYGQTEAVKWAFPLWEGAVTTRAVPNIQSERDACRFVVQNTRNFVTPPEMLHLDDGDIIDGCTAKLTNMSKQVGLRK